MTTCTDDHAVTTHDLAPLIKCVEIEPSYVSESLMQVGVPALQARCYHSATAFSLCPGWMEVTMFGGCPEWPSNAKTDADLPSDSQHYCATIW